MAACVKRLTGWQHVPQSSLGNGLLHDTFPIERANHQMWYSVRERSEMGELSDWIPIPQVIGIRMNENFLNNDQTMQVSRFRHPLLFVMTL